MLRNVALKMEHLFRRGGGGKQFIVIMDSVNSLVTYNAICILSEFMQVLMASMKSRGAYPVLLSMEEQMKPDVLEMLQLVCDQIVTLK